MPKFNTIILCVFAFSVGIFISQACSMGSKLPVIERKEADKLWRPCQDFETKEPVGKFCNRVCTDRNGKDCKIWKTNIKNFSDLKDFSFFRDGNFIMVNEKSCI